MNRSIFHLDSLKLSVVRVGKDTFTTLFHRYHHRLLRHGLRIVPDAFEVHSLVQDVLLKAWDFRERMTSPEHFFRFCRMNLTWYCYNHHRKSRHKILYTDKCELFGYCHESLPDGHPCPDEQLKKVEGMLAFLSPQRKKILSLYYQLGYSKEQIAEQFCTTRQRVHLELQKGVEQLRKMLLVQAPVVSTPPSGDSIWNLRLAKRSFESIAAELNLPLTVVQQQYIKTLSSRG